MLYSELSKAVRLAISEYEHFNRNSIEGYSFTDLIDWLDHFHYCESKTDKGDNR